MTNYADPNAFLMGGGNKSAKFDNEGDKVVGTIQHMEVRQQTDIKTNEPLFWDDAKKQPKISHVAAAPATKGGGVMLDMGGSADHLDDEFEKF